MKMAAAEGGPMYCLMSALSTKATAILSVMLEVVRITTLQCLETEEQAPQRPGASDTPLYPLSKVPVFSQRLSRLHSRSQRWPTRPPEAPA